MKVKKLTTLGILAGLAMILGLIENQFVLVPGVPGIKLGLSNIVLLFALCLLDTGSAWLLMITKVGLAALMYAGVTGAIYSLCGGLCSMAVMTLCVRTRRFGFIGISVAGAVFHIVGQVLISRLLLGTWAAAAQAPLLLSFSLVSGILTGIACGATCQAVSRTDKQMREKLIFLHLDNRKEK